MKLIDEFHNPQKAYRLAQQIEEVVDQPLAFMEVCGTHSHVIARHGLTQMLPPQLRLISGPGCPVCVTPQEVIDAAIQLAREGLWLAVFGDMMKVPGSDGSLDEVRATGGQVQVVYSPMQAIEWAQENPDEQIVFMGVGFETTAPSVAICISEANELGLTNFSVLVAHRLIPPAMQALIAQPDVQIDGFLCPGHVSAIIGVHPYQPLAAQGIPCVVAGFEPLDVLQSLYMLAQMCRENKPQVLIQYDRVVKPEGNPTALAKMNEVFEVTTTRWRGLGEIPASGLRTRDSYARFDAQKRFALELKPVPEPPGCQCGAVLRGAVQPTECPLFGTACRPDHPVGPCMVSSEGACAAVYRYQIPTTTPSPT